MKLKEIGEFGFIDRIAPLGRIRSRGVIKGIGDDCAVITLDSADCLLVTTDLLVEKVHFLMHWAPAETIGAKALAVNLSDIAACGGHPLDAFISLAVPENVEVEWLDGFYHGMRNLALDHDVNLLGGDTTGSKTDLVINVAVTGIAPKDQVLYRHTASEGDAVAITGPVGESGAGLEILLGSLDVPQHISDPLVRAHLEPRPHIKQGRLLAASGFCTAAIDISDGLSSDLGHLCQDSGLGAIIHEDKIPVSQALAEAAVAMGLEPIDLILRGGEDYVLLVAIKPEKILEAQAMARNDGWELFPIGEFVRGAAMKILRKDGRRQSFSPSGWDHFR